jgi:hypothetical protein
MYSRPEAWLSWHTSRPVDRPLKSLLHVVLLGVRGLVSCRRLLRSREACRATAAEACAGRRGARPVVWTADKPALSMRRASKRSASGSRRVRRQFQEVYELSAIGAPNGIALEGVGVSQNLFFGVPLTKVITSATLGLRYTSRMPSDGALLLWLNGTRLGTLRFTPGTDVQAEVTLPTDLLSTDNTLTLRLANCDGCGRINCPRLRSTRGARLQSAAQNSRCRTICRCCRFRLSIRPGERSWQLPVVFSSLPIPPRCRRPPSSHLVRRVFGRSRRPVSGACRRSSRRKCGGARVERFQPGGTPLHSETIRIAGRRPRESSRSVRRIADRRGDDAGDLLAAARDLVTRHGFPQDASFIAPRDVHTPVLERRSAPGWLATDKPAAIGMYTSADRLRLQGSGSVNIYFRLPPDLFLRARPSVPLLLKFEYAGAAQGGSPARTYA